MRVAAKDQLVIQSAAPYCSKFTTRKLPNATMKKKERLHERATLKTYTKYVFFFLYQNDGHKSLFTNCTIHRKKYKHTKIHKKITITN